MRVFPWRHYLLCLAPSILMLCAVAFYMGTGRELAEAFKALRRDQPLMGECMWYVSRVTPFLSYGLYGLFLFYGLKKSNASLIRLGLAYVILQLFISLLLVYFLKVAVGKPRPMVLLDGNGYMPFTLSPGNHSFPSGHSSEIMGTVIPLAARRRQYLFSLGLGLAAALVTFSRLYLSMHHISDIAAGLALGSVCGILIQYVSLRVPYERKKRPLPGHGILRVFQHGFSGPGTRPGYGIFRQPRRGAGLSFLRRFL